MMQILRYPLVTLMALLLAGSAVQAQSKADEAEVRNVPQAFAAAWATHDGQQLAKVMSEDVDFVNVSGAWLVAVAQNTNWTPPPNPDPEMVGIKHPIEFTNVEKEP